jgi:hypothetical protein
MPDLQKMLTAGRSIVQKYNVVLIQATVTETVQGQAAFLLCMTIAEQFNATLCLIQNGFASHSPVMVRSMLEGMADLNILVSDPSHYEQMRYVSAKEHSTIFEGFAILPETQHGNFPARMKASAAVSTTERDELKAKKLGVRQTAEEKFIKAGLGTAYPTYKLLCGFAHNDLTTLVVRHSGSQLRLNHQPQTRATIGILNTAFRLLTEAVALLPEFSDTQANELINARIDMDDEWAEASA